MSSVSYVYTDSTHIRAVGMPTLNGQTFLANYIRFDFTAVGQVSMYAGWNTNPTGNQVTVIVDGTDTTTPTTTYGFNSLTIGSGYDDGAAHTYTVLIHGSVIIEALSQYGFTATSTAHTPSITYPTNFHAYKWNQSFAPAYQCVEHTGNQFTGYYRPNDTFAGYGFIFKAKPNTTRVGLYLYTGGVYAVERFNATTGLYVNTAGIIDTPGFANGVNVDFAEITLTGDTSAAYVYRVRAAGGLMLSSDFYALTSGGADGVDTAFTYTPTHKNAVIIGDSITAGNVVSETSTLKQTMRSYGYMLGLQGDNFGRNTILAGSPGAGIAEIAPFSLAAGEVGILLIGTNNTPSPAPHALSTSAFQSGYQTWLNSAIGGSSASNTSILGLHLISCFAADRAGTLSAYNAAIDAAVTAVTASSAIPITTGDFNSALTYPDDFIDGVHPTYSGEQKMAVALQAILEPASASAFTLTGPSSGTVGVASTNFTVTPTGGNYTGTITPSAGAGGGTFTPTSLTWSSASDAKTFTYTPASTGAKTISATASPSLTAPSSLTYTANAANAVTGVSVSPSTVTANGGTTTSFTATVSGTGSFSQSVSWTVVSGAGSGDTFSSIGNSTCAFTTGAATSSDRTIVIRATAVGDGTKHGDATIIVPAAVQSSGTLTSDTITAIAQAVRAEIDAHSTRLAHLDADVSTRLATTSYTAAPTTSAIVSAVLDATDSAGTGYTIRQAIKAALAAAVGNMSIANDVQTIRNPDGTVFVAFTLSPSGGPYSARTKQ